MLIVYGLMILLIIICYINKSKLFSLFLGLSFICDISGWLRQQYTSYPKPYSGIGFVLFALTTCLFLLIPTLNWSFVIYSFERKIKALPVTCWLTACICLLTNYSILRGQKMLDAFYVYYMLTGAVCLIYCISKAKLKFTFSQAGLMLSCLGTIITSIIAIKEISIFELNQWILIIICNCIFYIALMIGSIINHFAKHLLP